MHYVIGDIHGEYEQLMILMEMIAPSDGDVIYALGDVIDRGPDPVKVVRYMMEHPNFRLIAGNHELMALECLRFLMQDITEDSIAGINETDLALLADWQINGCAPTLKGLRALTTEERSDVIEYLSDALAYEDIEVEGVRYILVHGGLGNYRPDRPLWDYSIDELVWEQTDFDRVYLDGAVLVTGHTPTQLIEGCPAPGYVYKTEGHIGLDCGACFEGGRLAAVCLETGQVFYSR